MEIIVQPKIEIEEALLVAAQDRTQEENQVIIHFQVSVQNPPLGIRIWKSTYLIPHSGNEKAALLHVDGISKAPRWTGIMGNHHSFTLIFEGLPKDCSSFDLVEDIPSPYRLTYMGITRNQTDVYNLIMQA